MHIYDVIVIGGGLLGCFAVRSLTRYDLKVALLEQREDLCTGISRANTAIVYSGCDNKPGSLKTSLCVSAAQGFPKLCRELGVRYSPCGSIMICFGERGAKVLKKKYDQGTVNGVRGMRLLSGSEILEMEPRIAENVHSGLYVPDTGTVMPWELCLAAAENAVRNGAEIILNTEVLGIDKTTGCSAEINDSTPHLHGGELYGYEIKTNNGTYYSKAIINCAGLSADKVLEIPSAPTVRIIPTAGDYYILDTKAAGYIKHVIFHEPEEKGKGLTLVPTVDGNILVGPTERPLDASDFSTSREGLELLRELASEVVPSLPMDQIISSFGAVRPNPYMLSKDDNGQWVTDDKSVSDFCIIESYDGSMISLVGVKTPGLTCSNELGIYVSDKISKLLRAAPNEGFGPIRPPQIRAGELDYNERRSLVQDHPEYGNIVCRCRGISEGEIINAIRRDPGAVTLDGVKRRTGTDSGRCQGGYCVQRIVSIMARELKCDPEDITKRGGKSKILFQQTKTDLRNLNHNI